MISGVEGSDIDRSIELDRQSEALLVAPQFCFQPVLKVFESLPEQQSSLHSHTC